MTENIAMATGVKITRLREYLGHDVSVFAKLSGLTSNELFALENGRGEIAFSTVAHWCEAYGLSIRYFSESHDIDIRCFIEKPDTSGRVELSTKLRTIMIRTGFTAPELAVAVGVPVDTLSGIMTGIIDPSGRLLYKISLKLGVDINYFFANRRPILVGKNDLPKPPAHRLLQIVDSMTDESFYSTGLRVIEEVSKQYEKAGEAVAI